MRSRGDQAEVDCLGVLGIFVLPVLGIFIPCLILCGSSGGSSRLAGCLGGR
jgi:hypothetical protein